MTFYYQDYREESVEAREKVVEKPKEWWEQEFFGVPFWAWLLIGGVGAAGVTALGFFVEEERRRELIELIRAAKR